MILSSILPMATSVASTPGADAASGLVGMLFCMFYGVLMFVFYCIFPIIGILSVIFWILMIVDAVQRKYENENDRTMWILIVVLTGVIGAGVYYFTVKKPADSGQAKVK